MTPKPEQAVNAFANLIQTPSAVEVLTKRLLQSDTTISDLRAEVRVLQSMVKKLNSENTELRTRLSSTYSVINGSESSDSNSFLRQASFSHDHNFNNDARLYGHQDVKLKRNQRPTSMYETREGFKTPNWQLLKHQVS